MEIRGTGPPLPAVHFGRRRVQQNFSRSIISRLFQVKRSSGWLFSTLLMKQKGMTIVRIFIINRSCTLFQMPLKKCKEFRYSDLQMERPYWVCKNSSGKMLNWKRCFNQKKRNWSWRRMHGRMIQNRIRPVQLMVALMMINQLSPLHWTGFSIRVLQKPISISRARKPRWKIEENCWIREWRVLNVYGF